MSDEPVRPDLPEWVRVISVFVLTFALFVTLAGLAGLKIQWVEDTTLPAEAYNRP